MTIDFFQTAMGAVPFQICMRDGLDSNKNTTNAAQLISSH